MIGAPLVLMNPTPSTPGTAVDITCLVDEVAIKHGRDDTTSQPAASTCTLDISLDTDTDTFPPGLEVGTRIEVHVSTPLVDSLRFLGDVTDTSVGWDDVGENTPNSPVLQVIAVGDLGDMGRRVVGDVPWPQELDGARVARIFAAAGVSTTPGYNDPGRVQILARDVDAQPALELAQSVAVSASGIVWQSRTGEVRYADNEHRRGALPVLTLDSCDVLVSPVWQRNTDGLINSATITYGVAPSGGQRPTYTSANATSQARFGRYDVTLTTELAALADAQALASLLTSRGSRPEWILSALPVAVADLDQDRTAALLSLDVNDLLELTGLPAFGQVPTSTSLWVEGWSERLAAGVHELTLSVSGFCRTVPPPHWDDIPPDVTWDTIGKLTWDDAACTGPLPIRGDRWDDVAASTRWDWLTPAQTWDTFTGETIPH